MPKKDRWLSKRSASPIGRASDQSHRSSDGSDSVSTNPHSPCIIGVAQRTWHLSGEEKSPEPLLMSAEVLRLAAADANATADPLAAVQSLDVVYCMSWPYDEPAARLAAELGITPQRLAYSGIGGTVPQQLLSAAAAQISAGQLEVAAVVGAEALDTKRRLKRAGERPNWSHRDPNPLGIPFEAPFHESEIAHEVFQAWLTFATRDIARRARLGVQPEQYRRQIGELLAPMTQIAATNPNAWFPQARTAAELVDVTSENRLVGYPYTKRTVAFMDVDMSAAVIIASHEAADRLGVPQDRRVYLRGSCYATDAVYLAEHPDLSRSEAMTQSFGSALHQAGVSIEQVDHCDLYSCFASSVHFAADALGIDPLLADRSLTVTGGLPYAGGPASNYLSHSIAAMVDSLRTDPGSFGLVSGVGMHMTKHIAAVYCSEPAGRSAVAAPALAKEPLPAPAALPIVDSYSGPATIATYSVVHGRDGSAQWGLVVVDLPQGASRAYGRVEDPELLARLEAEEMVGSGVVLTAQGKRNLAQSE